jgi:undecaprenyl-diphosphatase
VWYFRVRLIQIWSTGYQAWKNKIPFADQTPDERYGAWVLVSLLPTLCIAFVLRKQIDVWQNSLWIVIASTMFFGVVFWFIEGYSKKLISRKTKKISLRHLFGMGLAQAVSVIPGVSRSGSTVAGGLALGVSMKEAVEISFIMGIPVLFLATIYKIVSTFSLLSWDIVVYTFVGSIVAFFVGLWSIKLTLGMLTKHGFKPFMIYRLSLGLVLIAMAYFKVI